MHSFQFNPVGFWPAARRGVAQRLRQARKILSAGLLALLVACGSTPVGPGQYRVERGDTLSKIAASNGQTVANLVRWNKLSDANEINVGQVLRVSPPGSTGADTAVPSTGRPLPGKPTPVKPTPRPSVPDKAPPARIALVWPANGKLTRNFNVSGSKGIAIANAAGTPVIAAAPGTVAYAGSGLRGYGNLVILQHSSDFLTIYAHNRALMVKEGQSVRQGQKIAEMGNTDNSRVELYFELRYKGTPTNPTRLLPTR